MISSCQSCAFVFSVYLSNKYYYSFHTDLNTDSQAQSRWLNPSLYMNTLMCISLSLSLCPTIFIYSYVCIHSFSVSSKWKKKGAKTESSLIWVIYSNIRINVLLNLHFIDFQIDKKQRSFMCATHIKNEYQT